MFASVLLLNTFSSCGDPSDVGSGLFTDGDLDVFSVDTMTIVATNIPLDSVEVYSENNMTRSTYLLGELDDPFFGKMNGALVTELHYGVDLFTGQLFIPDYQEGDILDSIVLVLAVDTLGNYGVRNDLFDIEVFKLSESINQRTSIFAPVDIPADPTIAASAINVRPRADSVRVFFPSLGTTIPEFGQIRIPLNDNLANILFNDLRGIGSDVEFVEAFNGLRIEATPASGNSMFGVDISTTIFNSRVQCFYRRDSLPLLYEYALDDRTRNLSEGRKFTDFERDNASSPISQFLDDPEAADSLIFIQSMLGSTIELDLSAINQFQDNLINQATLEMTIAQLPGDNMNIYPPIETLVLSTIGEDGEPDVLAEINEGLIFSQLETFFGGTIEENFVDGMTVFQIEMNITRSLILMANGELPTTLFMTPLMPTERPNRTILFGPGHSTFPLRLNLSLTSL